jgi:hypothetical protein
MRTRVLTALVLFAIVAVEFGGWSLLGLLTNQNGLTPFQEQFFRAGHGHAGVLLILALAFLVIAERTSMSETSQFWLGITFLVGVLLQSGGFFLHIAIGEEGAASVGTWITRTGALLLAIALVSLGVGVLRSSRRIA